MYTNLPQDGDGAGLFFEAEGTPPPRGEDHGGRRGPAQLARLLAGSQPVAWPAFSPHQPPNDEGILQGVP